MSTELSNFVKDLIEIKGTNNKKEFISIHIQDPKNHSELMRYLRAVYSTENLYQSTINKELEAPSMFGGHEVDMDVFSAYEFFLAGTRRGSDGERRLSQAYNRCPEDQQYLLEFIVRGELKCGVGPLTWNKIFGSEIIYIPRYQRCSKLADKHHEKWEGGFIVQDKEDAQFINVVMGANSCELRTRNWNLMSNVFMDKISKLLSQINQNAVLMGEVYVLDQNMKRFGREKSNGIINGVSATGEDFNEECGGVELVLWDGVALSDFHKGRNNTMYEIRFELLQNVVEEINQLMESNGIDNFKVSAVRSNTVNDMEGVKKYFREVLEDHGEGLVIKNLKGIWEHCDKGHKDLVKVKLAMNVKLRIVGYNEADANSRHVNTFGSLQVESEDGKIITGASGLSDAMRLMIHNNREGFLNKIVEIKCNGIQYNPEEPHSLYYANFVAVREDVDKAQDFDDIVKVMDSAIEAIDMV